jgi:hypothetical protein
MSHHFPDVDWQQALALERSLRRGTRSFEALVADAAGLFPTEVLRFLEAKRSAAAADVAPIESIIAGARSQAAIGNLPQGTGLALPHPLDAEWRFTDATSQKLLNMAVAATRPSELILLIGVPSLAMAAAQRNDERRYVVYGEENVIRDGVIRGTASDRRFRHERTSNCDAAAVIVDPPWYLPEFREMLGQASFHCRRDGLVLISVPREGVRPNIREDLALMAEAAAQAGLELSAREEGGLIYRTPLFELNAMRASGVGAWLPEWRRGDLLKYRKRCSGIRWPRVQKAPAFELTLAGVRIRLLSREDGDEGDIVPIGPGDVFPSVSARAPGRAKAVLWTSGNRAFKAPHLRTLVAMLELSSRRGVLPRGLEGELSRLRLSCSIDTIEPLIQKLVELAEHEAAEAALLLGSAAWERATNDARFLNGS